MAAAAIPDEACGAAHAGFWFEVTSTSGTPARTIVTGAAGPLVTAVTVSGRGTSYPVGLARVGRSFLAVLPAGLTASDVTVSFRMSNGTTRAYTGQSRFGVLHIRRGAL
jgi:hypothetical protein